MKKKIRKIHRYLGIFIGLQFIMWTVSGLYFSWTDIDQIHGDNFRNLNYKPKSFNKLISPSKLNIVSGDIELEEVNAKLQKLHSLMQKHAATEVSELINIKYDLEEKVSFTENLDDTIQKKKLEISNKEEALNIYLF